MRLSDGTYISWWPTGQKRTLAHWRDLPFIVIRPGMKVPNLEEDMKLEKYEKPLAFSAGGLNEAAIRIWWQSFNPDPQNPWNWELTGQNCARTVMQGLEAGGAFGRLPPQIRAYFNRVIVWSPIVVLELMEAYIEFSPQSA